MNAQDTIDLERRPKLAPESQQNAGVWKRWYPMWIALAAIPMSFGITWMFTGQHMFSAVVTAIVTLLSLVVLKTWQSRGRVSLAQTIFVVPAIVALGCFCISQLVPLASRQATIAKLRNSNIKFRAIVPVADGEWLLGSSSGTPPLPTWFANWFGPDCMTEVRSLSGELQDLQEFDYHRIPKASIAEIKIRRSKGEPVLRADFVDWLDTCTASLDLDLKQIHAKELELLERLPPRLYEVSLSFDGPVPAFQLACPPNMLTLAGESLSKQAVETVLANRSKNYWTSLHVKRVSSEAIEAIGDTRSVRWFGTNWEVSNLQMLAAQKIRHLGLFSVALPEPAEMKRIAMPPRQDTGSEEVAIFWSEIYFQQLEELARILRCKLLATDLVLSDGQLRELFENQHLEKVESWYRAPTGKIERAVKHRGKSIEYQVGNSPPPRDSSTGIEVGAK